jgi:transcriptional regulator with XRE-family HTH domain
VQKVKDIDFLKKLGKRIRYLRLEKKYSQLNLAVKMDNYAEQIGRFERGQLNVSICTLKLIADSLDVDIQELFDFT